MVAGEGRGSGFGASWSGWWLAGLGLRLAEYGDVHVIGELLERAIIDIKGRGDITEAGAVTHEATSRLGWASAGGWAP